MRISDWSSDVCSSDLEAQMTAAHHLSVRSGPAAERQPAIFGPLVVEEDDPGAAVAAGMGAFLAVHDDARRTTAVRHDHTDRAVVLADIDEDRKSTRLIQTLMRTSVAVFSLKKTKK